MQLSFILLRLSRSEEWLEILTQMFLFTFRIKFSISVRLLIVILYIALISGVVSGFLGAAAGSLTFITTYNSLTYYFYANKKYSDWDFRLKNYMIYLSSDFSASFARIIFEVRK